MKAIINLIGSDSAIKPVASSLMSEFSCEIVDRNPFNPYVSLSCSTNADEWDIALHLNDRFKGQLKASPSQTAGRKEVTAYCLGED